MLEEMIIIDKSYFKINNNNGGGSSPENKEQNPTDFSDLTDSPSTLEDILDSIYQEEYIEKHIEHVKAVEKTDKEETTSALIRARKKYFI